MKKVYLYQVILMCLSIPFVLSSCTSDQLLMVENIPQNLQQNEPFPRDTSNSNILPVNRSNPYDAIGLSLYKKMDGFISKDLQFNSDESKINTTTLPFDSFNETANNFGLSDNAKLNFNKFLDNAIPLSKTGEQYQTLYNFIVEYESIILNEDEFIEKDVAFILTYTSVFRYATYDESANSKKGKENEKDPDWKIFFRMPVIKK